MIMGIPEKLVEDFVALRNVFEIIKRDSDTYNALYDDDNDLLLTLVARSFFYDIMEIMQRDWIMMVSKIMDPQHSRIGREKRENLSIELINKQLNDHGLFNDEIKCVSDSILEYGKSNKSLRNRLLAHFDRDAAISREQLGGTTREIFERFLEDIQSYSDLVGLQIGVGPLDFSCSGCPGDVYDFLKYLRTGEPGSLEKVMEKHKTS